MTSTEWQEIEMFVLKRDGTKQPVSFDKILTRFRRSAQEIVHISNQGINFTSLAMKVIDQLYDGISSSKIDDLCAEQCASLSSTHPDYNALAGRIAISSHHRNTSASFADVMTRLYHNVDQNGQSCPIVSSDLLWWVTHFGDRLDAMVDANRDYLIDYFGFKTLERAYLLKQNRRVLERPQHMWLRVALGIHGVFPKGIYYDLVEEAAEIENVLALVQETYDLMSQKYFTHATPTLFNAGTPRPQLSSCFLLGMQDDSINGIYETLKDCANISKWAGGIGVHIHNVRASGSYIRGTGGTSNGIVPMLRVFNHTAKYVDQCVIGTTLVLRRRFLPSNGQPEDVWVPISEIEVGDLVYNLPIVDPEGFSTEDFCRRNEISSDMMATTTTSSSQQKNKDGASPYIPGKNMPAYFDEDSFDTVKQVIAHACDPVQQQTIRIATDMAAYSLQLTPEHPVLIDDDTTPNFDPQWMMAKDVQPGMMIMVYCNTFVQIREVTVETGGFDTLYDLEMTTYPNYMTHTGLVHNGGGKRNGSFAIYLEPWHADIELFLQMRKNHGDEELKARDLFYALWVPDLFMERVKSDGTWTLMCPDECPGLSDVYGEAFVELYTHYEREQKGKKTMKARELWFQVLDAQMETGTPYLCYKDAANHKSNQKNVGVIKSSNLCVAAGTLVLTRQYGHRAIETMVDETVDVWNGQEWSEVVIKKTGTNQMLCTVFLRDQFNARHCIECSVNHKFYVLTNDGGHPLYTPSPLYLDNDDVKRLSEYHVTPFDALELEQGMILEPLLKVPTDAQNNALLPAYEKMTVDYVDFVEHHPARGDTYCFTEPKRHRGVFNGILTGQCAEIIEYSDDKESAVCNLASLALPRFMVSTSPSTSSSSSSLSETTTTTTQTQTPTYTFDFDALHHVTKIVARNLDQVIDVNYYPTEKTRRSNLRHRPIGIGVQGLADVFMMMGVAFDAEEARQLNRDIFETIYHAAIEASCEMAASKGAYASFEGSPASQGRLQFDLWPEGNEKLSGRYDWGQLKEKVKRVGLRNSLLVAPMPTASTSQILGYNECIEPITSNIYSRRTLAGEFVLCNKYLMRDLMELNQWNERVKNSIIANNGSVQHFEDDVIPPAIKAKYKTVWELPMKALIDMAADRGQYVCQSQSLNLWLEDPNYSTLTSMHFYAWSKGLKTGIYYLRRRAKHQAQQFTIEPEKKTATSASTNHSDEICELCSA